MIDLSAVVEKCLITPTADLKMVNLHLLIAGSGASSPDTVQSIVVDELTRRTPELLREMVRGVVERLKAEGLVVAENVPPMLPAEEKPRRGRKGN